MLIHLAFLLTPAHAAPTISDCSSITKSAPGVYDDGMCEIATDACTYSNGTVTCDPQTAGCDSNWTGAYYAVDYMEDRSISMFGTCRKPGTVDTFYEFCCHIDDTQQEVVEFELYGNSVGDESIDFIWDKGTNDEKNLRPTFTGSNRFTATAIGRAGNDSIQGANTTEANYAEILRGWAGIDGINGNDGDDIIYGDEDLDTIDGGPGDDRIYGGSGGDNLFGSEGNDKLYGQGGWDDIWGGPGNDEIRGNQGDDEIWGDAGTDTIYGGNGNDVIRGGTERDIIRGQNDDDEIYGEAGNDDLTGNAGEDYLIGGSGNDRINGGDGDNDYLDGQDGDDYLHGGAGEDYLHGGDDDDFLCEWKGYGSASSPCQDSVITGGLGQDTAFIGHGDMICVTNVTLTGSGVENAGRPEFDWTNLTNPQPNENVIGTPAECTEVFDLDPAY